jgi:protein-S-isoprenylcysteine O-methyltransferase Ste14
MVSIMSIDNKQPLLSGTPAGPAGAPPAAPGDEPVADPERLRARKRMDDRRGLWTHMFVYLVVNAFLLGAWLSTGAGYFWPGWVLGGWGTAIAMHGWAYFWQWHRPITEADIQAEVRRARGR